MCSDEFRVFVDTMKVFDDAEVCTVGAEMLERTKVKCGVCNRWACELGRCDASM